ncbi:hypothetical protein SNL152K_9593 [Streptomyces sp. NL15-2K]|nr:hypothetical protein SNL152K_9593 [Streptomyces sp. NL15-2K]
MHELQGGPERTAPPVQPCPRGGPFPRRPGVRLPAHEGESPMIRRPRRPRPFRHIPVVRPKGGPRARRGSGLCRCRCVLWGSPRPKAVGVPGAGPRTGCTWACARCGEWGHLPRL